MAKANKSTPQLGKTRSSSSKHVHEGLKSPPLPSRVVTTEHGDWQFRDKRIRFKPNGMAMLLNSMKSCSVDSSQDPPEEPPKRSSLRRFNPYSRLTSTIRSQRAVRIREPSPPLEPHESPSISASSVREHQRLKSPPPPPIPNSYGEPSSAHLDDAASHNDDNDMDESEESDSSMDDESESDDSSESSESESDKDEDLTRDEDRNEDNGVASNQNDDDGDDEDEDDELEEDDEGKAKDKDEGKAKDKDEDEDEDDDEDKRSDQGPAQDAIEENSSDSSDDENEEKKEDVAKEDRPSAWRPPRSPTPALSSGKPYEGQIDVSGAEVVDLDDYEAEEGDTQGSAALAPTARELAIAAEFIQQAVDSTKDACLTPAITLPEERSLSRATTIYDTERDSFVPARVRRSPSPDEQVSNPKLALIAKEIFGSSSDEEDYDLQPNSAAPNAALDELSRRSPSLSAQTPAESKTRVEVKESSQPIEAVPEVLPKSSAPEEMFFTGATPYPATPLPNPQLAAVIPSFPYASSPMPPSSFNVPILPQLSHVIPQSCSGLPDSQSHLDATMDEDDLDAVSQRPPYNPRRRHVPNHVFTRALYSLHPRTLAIRPPRYPDPASFKNERHLAFKQARRISNIKENHSVKSDGRSWRRALRDATNVLRHQIARPYWGRSREIEAIMPPAPVTVATYASVGMEVDSSYSYTAQYTPAPQYPAAVQHTPVLWGVVDEDTVMSSEFSDATIFPKTASETIPWESGDIQITDSDVQPIYADEQPISAEQEIVNTRAETASAISVVIGDAVAIQTQAVLPPVSVEPVPANVEVTVATSSNPIPSDTSNAWVPAVISKSTATLDASVPTSTSSISAPDTTSAPAPTSTTGPDPTTSQAAREGTEPIATIEDVPLPVVAVEGPMIASGGPVITFDGQIASPYEAQEGYTYNECAAEDDGDFDDEDDDPSQWEVVVIPGPSPSDPVPATQPVSAPEAPALPLAEGYTLAEPPKVPVPAHAQSEQGTTLAPEIQPKLYSPSTADTNAMVVSQAASALPPPPLPPPSAVQQAVPVASISSKSSATPAPTSMRFTKPGSAAGMERLTELATVSSSARLSGISPSERREAKLRANLLRRQVEEALLEAVVFPDAVSDRPTPEFSSDEESSDDESSPAGVTQSESRAQQAEPITQHDVTRSDVADVSEAPPELPQSAPDLDDDEEDARLDRLIYGDDSDSKEPSRIPLEEVALTVPTDSSIPSKGKKKMTEEEYERHYQEQEGCQEPDTEPVDDELRLLGFVSEEELRANIQYWRAKEALVSQANPPRDEGYATNSSPESMRSASSSSSPITSRKANALFHPYTEWQGGEDEGITVSPENAMAHITKSPVRIADDTTPALIPAISITPPSPEVHPVCEQQQQDIPDLSLSWPEALPQSTLMPISIPLPSRTPAKKSSSLNRAKLTPPRKNDQPRQMKKRGASTTKLGSIFSSPSTSSENSGANTFSPSYLDAFSFSKIGQTQEVYAPRVESPTHSVIEMHDTCQMDESSIQLVDASVPFGAVATASSDPALSLPCYVDQCGSPAEWSGDDLQAADILLDLLHSSHPAAPPTQSPDVSASAVPFTDDTGELAVDEPVFFPHLYAQADDDMMECVSSDGQRVQVSREFLRIFDECNATLDRLISEGLPGVPGSMADSGLNAIDVSADSPEEAAELPIISSVADIVEHTEVSVGDTTGPVGDGEAESAASSDVSSLSPVGPRLSITSTGSDASQVPPEKEPEVLKSISASDTPVEATVEKSTSSAHDRPLPIAETTPTDSSPEETEENIHAPSEVATCAATTEDWTVADTPKVERYLKPAQTLRSVRMVPASFYSAGGPLADPVRSRPGCRRQKRRAGARRRSVTSGSGAEVPLTAVTTDPNSTHECKAIVATASRPIAKMPNRRPRSGVDASHTPRDVAPPPSSPASPPPSPPLTRPRLPAPPPVTSSLPSDRPLVALRHRKHTKSSAKKSIVSSSVQCMPRDVEEGDLVQPGWDFGMTCTVVLVVYFALRALIEAF